MTLDHVESFRVVEADVDAIGHMTVRRYAELAEAVSTRLFEQAVGTALDMAPLISEITTRQHREQFLDAEIDMYAGVVAATTEGITFHIELRNVAKEELASTHLVTVQPRQFASRAPRRLHGDVVARADGRRIEQPAYGRPRRLGHEPIMPITLGDLASDAFDTWSERAIGDEECDDAGWFTGGPTELAWGPPGSARPIAPWIFEPPDGGHFAFPNVEHRRTVNALPRRGANVRTVVVNVALERNRRVRREWTFDLQSGAMYACAEFVDLCLDLDARRAVEIPDSVRADLTRYLRTDLAGPARDAQ
jgi:acyl-CoA thioesterase FadM